MKILEKLTVFAAFFLIGGLLLLDHGSSAVARSLRFTGGDNASFTSEIVIILSVAAAICAVLRLLGQANGSSIVPGE